MKSVISLLLLIGFISVNAQSWKLIAEEPEIKLYKKSVQGEHDIYKAETVILADIDSIIKEIYTFSNYVEWINECTQSREIDTTIETSTRKYGFSLNKTPWPLKDIDNYFSLDLERIDSLNCEIHFESLPDFRPLDPEYIRLRISKGFWNLKQEGDSVSITYQSQFKIPLKIPQIFLNNALKKSALTLINGLRSRFVK